MDNFSKSKQIYIRTLDYPIESVNSLKFDERVFSHMNIKKFIGSSWYINGSGYIWSGANNSSVVFIIDGYDSNEFNINRYYKMTHLNDKILKNKIKLVSSLFRNTYDNTTILEYRLQYENDSALEELHKLSSVELLNKIFENYSNSLINFLKENNKNVITLMNTFCVNKNYREVSNFMDDIKNYSKSINAEKSWNVTTNKREESDRTYYDHCVVINENMVINIKEVKTEEIKDKCIIKEYKKLTNRSPAMNETIKYTFFNIANNVCYILYETSLPMNVSSKIINTISDYIMYCNIKLKKGIEQI